MKCDRTGTGFKSGGGTIPQLYSIKVKVGRHEKQLSELSTSQGFLTLSLFCYTEAVKQRCLVVLDCVSIVVSQSDMTVQVRGKARDTIRLGA